MLAQTALALSLAVRIYDAYGVPDDQLRAARAAVEHSLANANVAVAWASCPCGTRLGPAELVIRIAAAPAASEPASLGLSYIDVDRRAGTLATVFADRVRALAAAAGADEGDLLGRAMAHEIGHLLLGTRTHDRDSLMRGVWTSAELARNRPSEWTISRADGAKMRQAVVRRSREPIRPDAVIAAAKPPAPGGDAHN